MKAPAEIRPAYQHSKAGTFMFNLCARWTEFVVKHKWLYYFLACTWGILMTLLGLIITLILAIAKIFDKTITFKKYCWVYAIMVGPEYWGGCEMGLMFLRDHKSSNSHIDPHEFGHTFQNCILGPLFPFVVAIPSACRYWARTIKPNKDWAPYDGFWAEDAATQCGRYADQYLSNLNQK